MKLIAGFIFKENKDFEKAKIALERRFGKIDFESKALDFNYTNYYEKEFGAGLKKKFVSFKKLISPQSLAKIKVITNKTEEKLSVLNNGEKKRLVNIDPGCLDLSKLVLASTKDYAHRIYLDRGIYVELTLIYRNKNYQPLDWTYPDYRTPEYIAIFNQIREIFYKNICFNTVIPAKAGIHSHVSPGQAGR